MPVSLRPRVPAQNGSTAMAALTAAAQVIAQANAQPNTQTPPQLQPRKRKRGNGGNDKPAKKLRQEVAKARPWGPKGPFRFRDLPPELRLQVYEEILKDVPDRHPWGNLVHDRTYNYNHDWHASKSRRWFDQGPFNPNGPTAILRTCKQLCTEAGVLLYQGSYVHRYCEPDGPAVRYSVAHTSSPTYHLRTSNPHLLDSPPTPHRGTPAYADEIAPSKDLSVSHQWERTSIRHLVLLFDFGDPPFHGDYMPDGYSLLSNASFEALGAMSSIKELRIGMTHDADVADALPAYLRGEGEAPVRSLIAGIPKGVETSWGIAMEDYKKWYYVSDWTDEEVVDTVSAGDWELVEGAVLKELADRFESLRGTDVEHYVEGAGEGGMRRQRRR